MFSKQLPKSPEGVFSSQPSPIDNLSRLVAYTTLNDLGMVVTATMSLDTTEHSFWARGSKTALVAAPIFIALLILCGWAILLLLRHERNRAELEVALSQNRMLFQEIHHRVKNNLQIINSLLSLQSRKLEGSGSHRRAR